MWAPLACLRGLAHVAAACCLVGIPMACVFQIKTAESNGVRIADENRKPLARKALVTADLDEEGTAPAVVEGVSEPVIMYAHSLAPRDLKGRRVLVFYSTARGGWRFISDHPEQLNPSTMDLIEAFPSQVQVEVAAAVDSEW